MEETKITAKYTRVDLDIQEKAKEVIAPQMPDPCQLFLSVGKDIINCSSSAIAACGLDGKMSFANPAFLKLWSFSRPEEFLGKPFWQFWQIENRLDEIMNTLKGGKSWFGEVAARRKDGSIFYVQVSASTVYDGAGNPIALTSTSIDITDHKRAEISLTESERMLRLALVTAGLAIWDWNIEKDTVVWHNVWPELIDEPFEKDHAREWWHKRIHPEDRQSVLAAFDHALNCEEESTATEYRFQCTDGSWQIVYDRFHVLRDKDGRPYRVIGALMDVSKQRDTENSLRDLMVTLERRVMERTELAEARSKQLQALAVELIEAEERERRRISQLLHDDLQQMLAAAKLQLQTACDKLPPEPILENLGYILEESIAKTRRLSHELSPAVLHYSGLVAGLKWLSGQMKEQFGLEVKLQADTNRYFDQSSLKVFLFRSVQELLFNVVKHSGVKCAHVSIRGADDRLLIKVRDHGCGFNPETMRADDKNTGFGLLSIKERAVHIGGDLAIESAPGKGSCFTLKVPFRLQPTEEPDLQKVAAHLIEQPQAKAPTTKIEGSAGLRVLFCDDHHVIRHGLVQLMRSQPGLQVVGEAADGIEAVQLSRQLEPDVVIIDVSMPGMDGIEATRRIKTERPQVRVIGLSMHDDKHISQTMRAAGAECLVSKTSASAELLRAIYGIRKVSQAPVKQKP